MNIIAATNDDTYHVSRDHGADYRTAERNTADRASRSVPNLSRDGILRTREHCRSHLDLGIMNVLFLSRAEGQ